MNIFNQPFIIWLLLKTMEIHNTRSSKRKRQDDYHDQLTNYLVEIINEKPKEGAGIVDKLELKTIFAEEVDEKLAAYIVWKLTKSCSSCGITSTPLWRRGPKDIIFDHDSILCNACGLKYVKTQYCPYCKYVYNKIDITKNRDMWVSCKHCYIWIHSACAMKYEGTLNIHKCYKCHK